MAYYSYDCCKDCKPPKRHLACQDHCPDKAKIQKKNDDLNEKIKNQRKIDNYVCDTAIKRTKRWKET